MDGNNAKREDAGKHCQVEDIRICTVCGSSDIKIDGDLINCNKCGAVLCFEHRKGL